jgi:hypothetical protein
MKLHITAQHKKTLTKVDLYFNSIKEAAFYNPAYFNFEIVGSE